MERLEDIRALVRTGRFIEALHRLDGTIDRQGKLDATVLRAELLERTGRYAESKSLSQKLMGATTLSSEHRSSCEFVTGLIDWDAGDAERALVHFQRALSFAEAAKDLHRTCWAQLRLMVAVAGRSGPTAAVPLLAATRWNATKLGDPIVSAALHIFIGEMEAKRGLLESASRHTRLGEKLLERTSNIWLEALAGNNHVAIALMRSEFDDGIAYGERALTLAVESGAAAMQRACLSNLANIFCSIGHFDRAIEYFERADQVLPWSTGEHSSGRLDGLARTHLLRERLDLAEECLDQIDGAIRIEADRVLYANRYAQLTRTSLLVHQGRFEESLRSVDAVLDLATRADDQLLLNIGQITKAEILGRLGRPEQSISLLSATVPVLPGQPPDVYAQYERALACGVLATGDRSHGQIHFERARRIYTGLRSAPGLRELDRSWEQTAGTMSSRMATDRTPANGTSNNLAHWLIQDIAMLMMHAGRPELLAISIVGILANADCVEVASAVSEAPDGSAEVLASCGFLNSASGISHQVISIGSTKDRQVVVRLQPRGDIESTATLNSISLLLSTVSNLETAQREREDRLTLWPLDDAAFEQDQAVITGRMQELMSFARKVARTNVNVLITGESGTGKEILARAIHHYSTRTDKAFIPFNCTAVPREMLESQLFGHKRGAFTSADRDNPGLIRAAKGGTLFLDEIGELGLDLQPKLLRFLESGEICPLGEPSPLIVDVRIVAATNRNLEQLVQDGRFREDLFYRLNVIPLIIPPLRERRDEIAALVHHFVARAAQEFSKERVRVSEETMEHLLLYAWPGNVRQLQNEVRRMVALAEPDSVLTPAALSHEIRRATPRASRSNGAQELAVPLTDKLSPTLSRIEREMIRVALRANLGRLDAAARALGISRKGLYLKRQRLGL